MIQLNFMGKLEYLSKTEVILTAVNFNKSSICYEKAGDWPNKNQNFTVQN